MKNQLYFVAGFILVICLLSLKSYSQSCTAVSIATQPVGSTQCSLNSYTFSVSTSGSAPITYQWKKNGLNIAGASNNSYTLSTIAAFDAGTYVCVVNNACGSATSNSAILTVITTPDYPGSITGENVVCPGSSNKVYSINPVSGANSYTWSVPLDAVISQSLNNSITVAYGYNSGYISVTANNSGCTRGPSTLFVSVTAPTITVNASSNSPLNVGGTLNLSATSITNATYIWTGPNNFTSTQQNPVISNIPYTIGGQYKVVASLNGCISFPSVIDVRTIMSGIYTVGSSGTFTSLTGSDGAFRALNSSFLFSNVSLLISSDLSEPGTVALSKLKDNVAGAYTLTIQPDAPIIRNIIGNATQPIIRLAGADSVIFDGRYNGSGSYLRIANSGAYPGSAAIELTDGASYNTLEYLNIQSSNTSNTSGTVYLYCSSGGPDNTNNIIQNCDIGPYGTNYPVNGICAYGYGPAYGNHYIRVLNNNIHDFVSSGSVTASGVIVSGTNTFGDYGHNWTISGNSFYRSVSNLLTDYLVITINFVPSPIASGTSTGNIISNNSIGGNTAVTGGSPVSGVWITAASGNNQESFTGILIEAKNVTVSGNYIGGIFDVYYAGYAGFTGIDVLMGCTGGNINVNGNTIGSTTGQGNTYYSTSTTSTSLTSSGNVTVTTGTGLGYKAGDIVRLTNMTLNSFYALYMQGNVTSYDPVTGSLTFNSTQSLGTGTASSWYVTLANGVQTCGQFYNEGIWAGYWGASLGSVATLNITNNIVSNLFNLNGFRSEMAGIITNNGGPVTIKGNLVCNLTTNSVNANVNNALYVNIPGCMTGISQQSIYSGVAHTVSNNTVYNLYSPYASSSANAIYGIDLNGVGETGIRHTADANFVHSLSSMNGGTGARIYGICTHSGIYNVTNNMVRLGIRPDGSSITGSADIEGITDGSVGSSSFGTLQFLHNSVYIGGSATVTGTVNTYAFRRNNTNVSPKDPILLENNIFFNNRSNASGTGAHFSIGLDNNTYVSSNYNDGYGTGTGYNFGQVNGVAYASRASWTAANSSFDPNSLSSDPLFVNKDAATPDLHVQTGTPVESAGDPAHTVTYDFDGQLRANLTPVDIGADAGNVGLCAVSENFTAIIGNPANGMNHYINLSWGSVANASGYQLDESTDQANWVNILNGIDTTFSFNAGDNPDVQYYFRLRTFRDTIHCNYIYRSIYTACDNPNLVAFRQSGNSLSLQLLPEIPVANPPATKYAVYCTTLNQWVQPNGKFGITASFNIKTGWGNNGTITVTGLTTGVNYCFYAIAQNGDGDLRYKTSAGINTIMPVQSFNSDPPLCHDHLGGCSTNTNLWYAPDFHSPIAWTSAYGNPAGAVGFGLPAPVGANNNSWGNFLKLPQQNCTGYSNVVLSFDMYSSYYPDHPFDRIRFYLWDQSSGSYKAPISSMKINGVESMVNFGSDKGFYFSQPLNWAKVDVTFNLSSLLNTSNIFFYIEPDCYYNDSENFFAYFDNIGLTAQKPATFCATPSDTCTAPVNVTISPYVTSKCIGIADTLLVNSIGAGTLPFTYQWNKNGTDIPGASKSFYIISSPLPDDAGTYVCVVKNNCGISTTNTAVITVDSLPKVFSVTGGGAYCSGGDGMPIGLSGSQTGVNYRLQLNGMNTTLSVPGTSSAITFGNLATAGTYTIVAAKSTTQCSADMSDSVTIEINPLPDILIMPVNSAICPGNNEALKAVGALNYIWNSGQTKDSIIVAPLITTKYTVTGTDKNGCSDTTSTVVKVNPMPYVTIEGKDSICDGAITTLSANGGSFYLWSTGQTSQSIIVSPAITSTYSLTVTNINGCSQERSKIIQVNPLPTPYNVTGGGSYYSGGMGVSVGLSNSDTHINYQLLLNGNNIGAPVLGTGSALSLGDETSAGTYTVIGVNTKTGCVNMMIGSAIIIVCDIQLNVKLTNATCDTCHNGSATVDLTNAISPLTWTWNTSPLQTTQTAKGLAPGTYTVCVTDLKGCSACDNTVIIDNSRCKGFKIFTGSANSTCKVCADGSAWVKKDSIFGGTAPYWFTWYSSPMQNTDTAYGLALGKYLVCVIDVNGCKVCDSITVNTGSCSGHFELYKTNIPHVYEAVNMASGIKPLHYLWNWGDGSHDTAAFPKHIFSKAGFYKICLTITDLVGCENTYCSPYYLQKSNDPIIEVDVIPYGVFVEINENAGYKTFNIYPNPANEFINLDADSALKLNKYLLKLRNIDGQEVLSEKINILTTCKINVSSLCSGVYILTLQNDKEYHVRKVVIQK